MPTNICFKLFTSILLGLLFAMVAVMVLPAASRAAALPVGATSSSQTEALTQALEGLVTTYQNDDGGYTSFSNGANQAASNVDGTTDAILAIASAGYNPNIPYPGQENSPIVWMTQNITRVSSYAADASGGAAKVILALAAANLNPQAFMGHNFVISLTDQLSPTGQFKGNFDTYGQSLAMLALRSVSETVPVTATRWLTSQQTSEGYFDGPDQTGAAIMALLASGVPTDATAIVSATTFLANTQLDGGGWRPDWDTVSPANPNSTALVYQGLLALGEDVGPGSRWDKGSVMTPATPIDALLAEQNDTGNFLFFGADNYYSTVQAIPALAGQFFPLPAATQKMQVGQSAGGAVSYADPPGRAITVTIPAGAVLTDTEIRLEPFVLPPTTTTSISSTLFGFANQVFALKAFQGGSEQANFDFEKPVTLTLKYSDDDIIGDEDSLEMFYWDGSRWATDGITVVERRLAVNEIVVAITHFSQFGLFGQMALVFLPVILRDS